MQSIDFGIVSRLSEEFNQCDTAIEFQQFYERYKNLYPKVYNPYKIWLESHNDSQGYGNLFYCLEYSKYRKGIDLHAVFCECLKDGYSSGGSDKDGSDWYIDFDLKLNYSWNFHCVQEYCVGELPDIHSDTIGNAFCRLSEFDIHENQRLDITKPVQLINLTHVDNAGAHVCQWEVTRLDINQDN